MVRRTRDFCSRRYASVTVGGYESEAMEIEYAGIPQGSPLLPLLYIFYNADLIKRKIDSGVEHSVFLTAWQIYARQL
jgi:hypothetical protein